jgi:hypothetical protein
MILGKKLVQAHHVVGGLFGIPELLGGSLRASRGAVEAEKNKYGQKGSMSLHGVASFPFLCPVD